MKNNITLLDTNKFGPASTQLQRAGKLIGDSWYKDASTQIFEEFKIHANKAYRLVGCDELDEIEECGLCAHDILYGCELEAIGEPLVTNHPDLDTAITWPDKMVIGTTCVKMLGLDSYVMRFVRSCFESDYRPSIKISDKGYVYLWGDIIRHPEKWDRKYDRLVLPHAVFNLIPKDIMHDAGLKVHVLMNTFDPKRKLEKTIYRSHKSKSGKWRTEYTVEAEDSMYGEHNDYRLATVLTREDARKVYEIQMNKTGK